MWPVPLVRVRGAHHTAAQRAQEERVTSVDRRAVVDLLGVLAYAELTAFDRLAEDARLAPKLTGRAALARMAAAEIAHHVRLTDRLAHLRVAPGPAVTAFVSRLVTLHQRSRPSPWPA